MLCVRKAGGICVAGVCGELAVCGATLRCAASPGGLKVGVAAEENY